MDFVACFCFIFFTFTALFTTFSVLIFLSRLLKPCCSCEICKAYVNSSWTKDFTNLSDWYTHLLRKSPTATIHIHILNNIVTADPTNVKHMLKTKFHNYPKGKHFSAILSDLLGKGIFNVDGECWMFQRKMASLELGSVSIRSYAFDLVTTEVKSRLLPLLYSSQDRVLDLQDLFQRFSFDVICKFSFGLDPNCLDISLPISEFASAFDLATMLSARRALSASPMIWKLKRFLNVGSERKLKKAVKMVKELANEMIKELRHRDKAEKTQDLMTRFMHTIHDDDDYLRDVVVSFLLAGRDTIASGLTSCFWLLLQNPEVQSEIQSELDRVMGPTDDKEVIPSFGQMREMHYLNAVVHESLRLYPPVQFDSKFAVHDDVLPDGTFIERDTRVTYHQYAMGRMESIWGPDCLEFKPERWLKNGVFVPESQFNYTVFHAGSRGCLGKEIALVEMKCVVAAVVRGFKTRVVDPNPVLRFSPGLTATVKDGLPVVIQERKKYNKGSCQLVVD